MLSILIPTYNYAILALVKNVHQQCLEAQIPFEIICLDDQSNNDYQIENQVISTLPNCIYNVNQTNVGRTRTRQRLAEQAKYDWLLFLDADVIPVTSAFIQHYIDAIQPNTVIFGGYQYEKESTDASKILRYRYGKEREEKYASERNKNPYTYVFSGNMLVPKSIFLNFNYQANEKNYGMDIYFGYQLYQQHISVLHLDNPILHLGLETNEVYFQKALQGVESRKKYLLHEKGVDQMNPLVQAYSKLKKLGLTKLVAVGFKMVAPFLKRNILSTNPKLVYFDIYRLGYLCSLE
ncbi:glycosyltransferase [Flavobacterium sp.]|uniref:glycosyltransferase family 2 protein n=1 Tax=Flavobacterium sp. TaxID=239 RepID=UPI0025BEE7BA|nr:glycosyltransferase [Flavobacterium sp.]MBA4154937.1 glycosyl transferase [Flavobacterium sp.]